MQLRELLHVHNEHLELEAVLPARQKPLVLPLSSHYFPLQGSTDFFLSFKILFIHLFFREKGRERQRNINMSFVHP